MIEKRPWWHDMPRDMIGFYWKPTKPSPQQNMKALKRFRERGMPLQPLKFLLPE